MNYKISYKSSVEKDLRKIDRTQVKRILDKIDTDLPKNPGKDKKLSGEYKNLYSYRVGNYRVIYTILSIKKMILILSISHRKDAYRSF